MVIGATVAMLALGGCGADDGYKNLPRPPTPVIVSASISSRGVSLSPSTFGAGPVTIVIANQTDASQQVTLTSAGDGAGIRQHTGPINPSDTANMKAKLRPGRYRVSASASAVPGFLHIGPERPNSSSDLMQP